MSSDPFPAEPPFPAESPFPAAALTAGFSPHHQIYISNCSVAEETEKYRPGGFHPTHLGDSIHDYEIVHKLGHSTFSTVWLANDKHQQRYVALKIYVASNDSSERSILQQLDSQPDHPGREFVLDFYAQFMLTGPNGAHLCIVSEFLGPSISTALAGDRPQLAAQAARGVAYLHACGVSHGNLHFGNLLLHTPALALATQIPSNIEHYLGPPQKNPIRRHDGKPNAPHAPEYEVVAPELFALLSLPGLEDEGLAVQVRIVDFGLSFRGQPGYAAPEVLLIADEQEMGLPLWAAPELLLRTGEGGVGLANDIWTLGVVMFEMVTGRMLFPGCDAMSGGQALATIREAVYGGDLEARLEMLRDVEFVGLLRGMLRLNPRERLTAKEVVDRLPVAWG